MNDNTSLLEDTGQDINLSELQTLVKQMFDAEDDVATKELELKQAKERLDNLQTKLIPDKMGNIEEMKVNVAGRTRIVKIKKVFRANIKKEDKPVAYVWLDEHDHGDLIKTELIMEYPRKSLEAAKADLAKLHDLGFSPELHQDIHWATLDAWAREQRNLGMEFPPFIGTFEAKKAEVKDGK
jgi:hypothetical protein